MPADPQEIKDQKEALSGTESVSNLLKQKESENAKEGADAVAQSTDAVKSEIADVMGGMEKPSEKISKRVREDKKGDLAAGTGGAIGGDDGTTQTSQGFQPIPLPSEVEMIKKVRRAIEAEISAELKKAATLKKQLAKGKANEFNQSIAKIRTLKETLSWLLSGTFDMIKGLYLKYFHA